MELNQVAQYEIEEQLDRQKVFNNLTQVILKEFHPQVLKGVDILNDWLHEPASYPSKKVRKYELRQISIHDVVLAVYVRVLELQTTQIQAIVASILKYMPHDSLPLNLKSAAEIITVLANADVYDVYPAKDTEENRITVVAKYDYDKDIRKYINDTQYLPPMLCEPRTIRKNTDCGYLTLKDHVILGDNINHHNKPLRLDVINMFNQVPLCLDVEMLQYPEVPNKVLDTLEKKEAFNLLVQTSRKVYRMILDEGNTFWFTWRMDFRGRLYSQGYHANFQASDYKKSLVSLKQQYSIPLDGE